MRLTRGRYGTQQQQQQRPQHNNLHVKENMVFVCAYCFNGLVKAFLSVCN